MGANDDLDLIRLFGLSAEEASGLGLGGNDATTDAGTDAAQHTPADPAALSSSAPGGLPDIAEPAGRRVEAVHDPADDELTLLAMLDDAAAHTTSSYSGYGAARGLSLADTLSSNTSQPSESGRVTDGGATELPSTAVPEPWALDDDGSARFAVLDESASTGDDNLIALFGLSAEEALGLGLPASAFDAPDTTHEYDAQPSPSLIYPTMLLHAVDEAPSLEPPHLMGTPIPAAALSDRIDGEPTLGPLSAEIDAAYAPEGPGDDSMPQSAGLLDADDRFAALNDAFRFADDGDAEEAENATKVDAVAVAASARISSVDPDLLDAYAQESAELLDALHVELERLEDDADDHGALLEARRIIHTIKGGAKMCGFEHVAVLTHACENLLDAIAEANAALDAPVVQALFDCEPVLRATVHEAIAGTVTETASGAALAARFDGLLAAFQGVSPYAGAAEAEPGEAPPATTMTSAEPPSAYVDAPQVDAEIIVWDTPVETAAAASNAPLTDDTEAVGAVADEQVDVVGPRLAPGDAPEAEIADPTTPASVAPGLSGSFGRPWPVVSLTPPSPAIAESPHETPHRSGGRRTANSINVDLTKVDAVVAKITEMAAHRVSSQGMLNKLLETSEDARRNVTRLRGLVMQLSNECASFQPEETTRDDDLNLETYSALNTLLLQLQEAVTDQQGMVQSIHDTITSHWSLQAMETRADADIQSALMSIRLVPIASMRVRLDSVVRQAAEATGKRVRWQLQGGNVALEKNVFDRLFEPLMHLLRNAVDHGIENLEARQAAGKPEIGSITVAAAQEGNQIVLTVCDDGSGIIPNKMAAHAVERGLITAEQANAMTYQQKMGLIFLPGFSTADTVSHLSGRGVGMDAVHEACLRMGGSIDVSSQPGSGTTFTMRLPLSLSVTRGLIVRDGGCLMVMPVSQVFALHLVPADDIAQTGAGRVARIEGQELPVYNLPPLPGARSAGYVQNGEVNVLQVAYEGGSIGLVIEDVLGEEEILIKAAPTLLHGVKTLMGAYVLPDGNVAPVVNLPQMLADLRPVSTLLAPKDERTETDLVALVVDDSMSMRVALSGTLQSAGFKVVTARDGQEALDVLKRDGVPSLITLDVEMPRMDGLETLYAIRQMHGADEVPVFMMTSRGGGKHRRAAEQLGATRYFTKPYRDSELASAARDVCALSVAAS